MTLTLTDVQTVFYFVSDLAAAVEWYSERLGAPPVDAATSAEHPQLATFAVPSSSMLVLHQADDVNAVAGGVGTVPYWTCTDVDAAAAECVAAGATVHRGPKEIFTGETLVQLLDPFGNLLGLRQPSTTGGRV